MRKRSVGIAVIAAAVFLLPLLVSAQLRQQSRQAAQEEQENKYVRLMSAQSVKILEKDGRSYRSAEGPARFLHNDTWLICDSALWDVEGEIIHAMGNVSIEQENTELTSDSLTYFVHRNVAEFRGALVQLRDKDNNILRSRDLDYNTRDSVATFRSGGAMRDKDGQLIESVYGSYDGVAHLFTFRSEVNMFTDSVFIKTNTLIYNSDSTLATFPVFVEAWRDDKMISSGSGWYNRGSEQFFFTDDVHMMSQTQEGWCDTLFYNRRDKVLKMFGNAQALDEERGVSSAAGNIIYLDSTSTVRMTDDPVVLMEAEQKKDSVTTVKDSIYFRADTIRYWTVMRFELDSSIVQTARERLDAVIDDPVENIRKKAAEQAAKLAEEAAKNDPNRPPDIPAEEPLMPEEQPEEQEEASVSDSPAAPADSLAVASDSLTITSDSLAVASDSLAVAAGSLAVAADSLAVAGPLDSTKIGFLKARGCVRIFRESMQVVCDSLEYCDVDSLARLYKDPVIFNEGRHQYQADSIWIAVRNSRMEKANLLSNAFVMVSEEDALFDQIRSAEMSAFFDEDSQLRRFDAMGGATALFYIKEKEKLSTANKKETAVLSAVFHKGEIQSITYFENPKSDVYPIAQMKQTDKTLKGFDWRPELRPSSPSDITSRTFRKSQRTFYSERSRASFSRTAVYFPGYIENIHREIARADSLRRVRRPAQEASDSDSLVINLPDSLGYVAVGDTVEVFGPVKAESDFKDAGESVPAIAVALTKEELRAQARQRKKEMLQRKRAQREEERQKRWDELDLRDAMRQAAKDARKREIQEAAKARQLQKYNQRKAREDALREKYKQLYLTKWNKKLLKSISTGSGEPSLP